MKICKQSSEKQIYYPDVPFNTNENNVVLDNDGYFKLFHCKARVREGGTWPVNVIFVLWNRLWPAVFRSLSELGS